jgi:hypothetical protein
LYRFGANFSGGDLASTSSPGFPAQLWAKPLDDKGAPFPFRKAGSSAPSEYSLAAGRFSPDGHWVAFLSNESSRNELYVASFPDGHNLVRVSPDGAGTPRWSRDGSELFFIRGDQLYVAAVSVTAKNGFQVDSVRPMFPIRVAGPQDSYDVFPDGERFLFAMQAQETKTATPITVEFGWTEPRPSRNR